MRKLTWTDHVDLTREEENLQTFTCQLLDEILTCINRNGNENIPQVAKAVNRPQGQPQISSLPQISKPSHWVFSALNYLAPLFLLGYRHSHLAFRSQPLLRVTAAQAKENRGKCMHGALPKKLKKLSILLLNT